MNKIMMQIAFALSALVAAAAHATDLNHASAFQLEAINGIGEKMAATQEHVTADVDVAIGLWTDDGGIIAYAQYHLGIVVLSGC